MTPGETAVVVLLSIFGVTIISLFGYILIRLTRGDTSGKFEKMKEYVQKLKDKMPAIKDSEKIAKIKEGAKKTVENLKEQYQKINQQLNKKRDELMKREQKINEMEGKAKLKDPLQGKGTTGFTGNRSKVHELMGTATEKTKTRYQKGDVTSADRELMAREEKRQKLQQELKTDVSSVGMAEVFKDLKADAEQQDFFTENPKPEPPQEQQPLLQQQQQPVQQQPIQPKSLDVDDIGTMQLQN